MLYDFLFKTLAGYCTYYAGASLFMLRALGVPTRFTTGFATINRSDKNKGWYWFYASQAHAWTQVYFPGYGWLDFDMTIGNEDQQGAPKPDGTPPLPPPEPWLVLNAKAESVIKEKKQLDASYAGLIYFNTPYLLNKTFTSRIDASLCRILYNKRDTTISAINPGDSLIIVSYKDEAKKIPQPRPGVTIEEQVATFPSPIIADEIHIHKKEQDKKKDSKAGKQQKQDEKKINWPEIAWLAGKISVGLILLVLLFPLLYFAYRLICVSLARSGAHKADQVYRVALYRFHMAGLERESETPLEYAQKKVDPALSTGFEEFMYDVISRFSKKAGPCIRKKNGILKTVLNYFNVLRAIRFFQQPESTDNETISL
jgi:hypothetical protein